MNLQDFDFCGNVLAVVFTANHIIVTNVPALVFPIVVIELCVNQGPVIFTLIQQFIFHILSQYK